MFAGQEPDQERSAIEDVLKLARQRETQIKTWLVVRGDVGGPSIAWEGPVLHDHRGGLHRRFGARGACLYLIRPDVYLGYRSMPPDSAKLATYLERIFVV
jgi:hypothetical protein